MPLGETMHAALHPGSLAEHDCRQVAWELWAGLKLTDVGVEAVVEFCALAKTSNKALEKKAVEKRILTDELRTTGDACNDSSNKWAI